MKPLSMDSWPGSPWWYLVWLLALCALAAIAALLRGAQRTTRTRLLQLGAACWRWPRCRPRSR